jgi:hypothetical protein
MAKLTSKARNSLPKSDFLGPGRTFPGNDKNHLRAAISGATRAKNAGNISASTAEKIQSKARAKLDGHRKARGFK